jgi:hypothetical protein
VSLQRLKCFSCGSSNLRFSHFRLSDAFWLALAKLPVRCRYCRERFRLNLLSAIQLHRERRATNEGRRGKAGRNQPPNAHRLDVLMVQQRAIE